MNKIIAQYQELKSQYPDHLLLVKLGDFYEAFGDDARIFADACNLALASRPIGNGRILMAGVPHFSLDKYIKTLMAKGYKVALARKFGTEKIGGVFPRQVTRLIEGQEIK